MSELATTIHEALAALAANDRNRRRFGAAHHRYALAPPQAPSPDLPDELAMFVRDVGSGGAGPFYGWIPVERAARFVIDAPDGVTWTRALPIAHLGCGYAAVMPLDGDARGEVWCDARAVDLVAPITPTFTAFYVAWIDRLAHNTPPPAYTPPSRCVLPSMLSAYVEAIEARQGIAAGTLAGEPLREALGDLPAGGIQLAAQQDGLFAVGERVDPCIACATLVETLASEGLRRDVVAAGLPPRPLREML